MSTTTTTIHLPLLDSIRIATPCDADWNAMTGDERKRHCAQCDLDVHNISALSREEAEGVLAGLAQGRVCARFFRRADGTILTKDCPRGIALARQRVLKAVSRVAAAVGLAVLAGAAAKAAQDTRWGNYGWSMRLANSSPVQWVDAQTRRLMARLNPPKYAGGMTVMGEVAGPALPPGPPPPVQGMGGTSFGPHEWEYVEKK